MINFFDIENTKPFKILISSYQKAYTENQKNIEALCLSSYNASKKEISSRYVNLKYIKENKFFFFSNYNSPKAIDFLSHDQVAANIYWNSINFQIRIKGIIKNASTEESDNHFKSRSIEKNALAISSNQSKPINSIEDVKLNYQDTLNAISKNVIRPKYWGGFFIEPYYFEFWKGNPNRLNERDEYTLLDNVWVHQTLEP